MSYKTCHRCGSRIYGLEGQSDRHRAWHVECARKAQADNFKPRVFDIKYTNPQTQETERTIQQFEDGPEISARDWAEDWAYAAADKGWYALKDIT